MRTKLTDEEVARFIAQRFRFPGVEVRARLFRNYPLGEVGSHLIGYIGRINQAEKKAMEDWPEEDLANYRGTEYIGKLGIEQSYESRAARHHRLRGSRDERRRARGAAAARATPRHRATRWSCRSTSDCRRWSKRCSAIGAARSVALDPRNGEVLAFVSKPTFDPNLFVDGIDSESGASSTNRSTSRC